MSTAWFLAITFTLCGLFSGYVCGHWDGLGQAFVGAMGAMLLGVMIERKWPSKGSA